MFLIQSAEQMRTWVLHELMASTLFLLLLVSLLYILFQKREQPERAPVFFFLCFQSFPIRARRWKQLPPGRYWIEVWAAGRALKQRNATRSDHVHGSDVPHLHPLTLSGCKARTPPSQRFLFGHLAVHTESPGSRRRVSEGLHNAKREGKGMKMSHLQKEERA